MVHSTRRFVLSLALCYFVLVFFSPLSIKITSLGEERANLSAFRTFVRFALVWFCLFPLPPDVWEWLRLVTVEILGLLSYLFLLKLTFVTPHTRMCIKSRVYTANFFSKFPSVPKGSSFTEHI